MKNKELKIAGIVTLYNPTDTDISNIFTYIDDIDVLYIIDNTEGNSNENRIPENNKIQYIFKNENVGVATALNIGANKAIEEGYEWLLTMDQDTTFKPGVIKEMKKIILSKDMSKIGIVTPWHNTKLETERPKDRIDYPLEVMTSGNLVNLRLYQEIGGYKDWMFIDGIDIEYGLNLSKNGYKIMRLNYLEIEHNLGDIFYRNILWKRALITNHSYLRRYYMVRNYSYIRDMYRKYNKQYVDMITKQKAFVINILLFEKDKYRKIRNMLRGYMDYKKGIKGKYRFKD